MSSSSCSVATSSHHGMEEEACQSEIDKDKQAPQVRTDRDLTDDFACKLFQMLCHVRQGSKHVVVVIGLKVKVSTKGQKILFL